MLDKSARLSMRMPTIYVVIEHAPYYEAMAITGHKTPSMLMRYHSSLHAAYAEHDKAVAAAARLTEAKPGYQYTIEQCLFNE